MKMLNTLCLSALVLGAIATIPALAQGTHAQPGQRDNARTLGQAPDQGMSPGMEMDKSTMPKSHTMKRKMGMNASDGGMNGGASMNANMSGGMAMGSDTSKKYVRSHRAADFASEQEVTKQLNQQNGVTTTGGGTTR